MSDANSCLTFAVCPLPLTLIFCQPFLYLPDLYLGLPTFLPLSRLFANIFLVSLNLSHIRGKAQRIAA
jgi:hypothetical protein